MRQVALQLNPAAGANTVSDDDGKTANYFDILLMTDQTSNLMQYFDV